MRRHIAGCLGFVLCAVAIMPCRADSPDGITAFPAHYNNSVYAVSSDGTLIVGWDNVGAVVWDALGNESLLPGSSSPDEADAISPSGIIVGRAGGHAAYWTTPASSPVVILPTIDYPLASTAYGISADNAYATGTYGYYQAFVYRFSDGNVAILPDSFGSSIGYGVASGGAIAVGYDAGQPVYWYNGGSGTTYSEHYLSSYGVASAITPDATVIVGQNNIYPNGSAVRWLGTPSGGYTEHALGDIGGTYSAAKAVTPDGSTIVGEALDGASSWRAFRWTSATGMQSIEDWLSSNGITYNLSGDHTYSATGVSSDGSVVVGNLDSGDGFIARVSPTGTGLVALGDFSASLAGNTPLPSQLSQAMSLVVNGAHGHPLMRLVPTGKSTAWISGDAGGHANHSKDAYADVIEVGAGHRFSDKAQFNVSVGELFAGTLLEDDGHFFQRMTYVMPEALVSFGNCPVWGTFGMQYASGPLDIRRAYLNAGSTDFSKGSSTGTVLNLRARIDWKDAAVWQGIAFTPYLDHLHTESWMEAYTESGGGFPASWESRHQHDDVSRLGIDAAKALTREVTLIASYEQSRNWREKGSGASGQVLGLSNFNLSGQPITQNSSRFSLGATHRVGAGQFSLFGNAQTAGQNPQYWVAAGYQYTF